MSKHTPGPWHVVKGYDERSWMVDSDNGTPIAAVPDVRLNARENARLIAAAPDLLRCAKLTAEMLATLQPLFQKIDDVCEDTDYGKAIKEITGTIAAVIAKAEGK